VVLGDGEHHNAAVATLDFLGNRDRISSLRLYPHAEADKKAAKARARGVRGAKDCREVATFVFDPNQREIPALARINDSANCDYEP